MGDARANGGTRLALLAIGLPVLGGGLAAAWLLVWPDVALWLRAREFVAVHATLLQVKLVEHRGKTKTEEVRARYQYELDGQTYESARVAIHEGADNIGSFQHDLYQRLQRAQRRGEAVDAWVDPASPNDALLDRELRLELLAAMILFSGVFALVGAWFTAAAFVSPQTLEAMSSVRGNTPVGRSARGPALYHALSAAALGAVIVLAKGNRAAWVQALLCAVWVVLVYRASVRGLQWWRFGTLHLHVDGSAGRIGGVLSGSLDLSERFAASNDFWWRLACVRHERSGGKGNVRRTTVWHDDALAKVEPRGRGVRLHFRFELPAHLPPTERPDADYHAWTLHVSADLAGADLDQDFEVRVRPADKGGGS